MIANPVIITKRNVNSDGETISIYIIETKQIFAEESVVVLKQVPDELYRVKIQGYKEVFDRDKLKANEFKVDYVQGVVYFHPKAIGKTIVVEYYGIGYELISCSRIFTKYDKYGNVLETLEELIGNATEQLELIKTLGDSVAIIDKLENDITNAERLHDEMETEIANLEARSNEEILVASSEWVLNGDTYEKTIAHNCNSQKLHITFIDSDNEGYNVGYKILTNSTVLLKSDYNTDLRVIVSGGYYKPLINGDGAILTSPNGIAYKLKVSDGGVLSVVMA